jgi:acyl dehydratase
MVMIVEYDDLENHVGEESDWSEWMEFKQEDMDTFAHLTGDLNWIHIDVERSKKGPWGSTIVSSYHTLSTLPVIQSKMMWVKGKISMGVNYGFDKIRFTAPIPPSPARFRAKQKLLDVKKVDKPGPGKQYKVFIEIWVEGNNKPSLIAENITRLYE